MQQQTPDQWQEQKLGNGNSLQIMRASSDRGGILFPPHWSLSCICTLDPPLVTTPERTLIKIRIWAILYDTYNPGFTVIYPILWSFYTPSHACLSPSKPSPHDRHTTDWHTLNIKRCSKWQHFQADSGAKLPHFTLKLTVVDGLEMHPHAFGQDICSRESPRRKLTFSTSLCSFVYWRVSLFWWFLFSAFASPISLRSLCACFVPFIRSILIAVVVVVIFVSITTAVAVVVVVVIILYRSIKM